MDKKNSFFAYENLNMYVYGDQDTISGGSWKNEDEMLNYYLDLVKMNNITKYVNPYMKNGI